MSKHSRRAPKFHILCPDQAILDDFRGSNRLALALGWHTPHVTTFGKQLEQQAFERLSEDDYIFCFFPLTKSDRILERYVELMLSCRDMGVDCFVYTFHFGAFDSPESMIDWLTTLIVMQIDDIYGPKG